VLQNVSGSVIYVVADAKTDGITVSKGSTVIWRSSQVGSNASGPQTVQPGSNVTLNAVWNGRANQRGAKRLGPGFYTIQVTEGGYAASATFRVVG
jgi:hypothetical protein